MGTRRRALPPVRGTALSTISQREKRRRRDVRWGSGVGGVVRPGIIGPLANPATINQHPPRRLADLMNMRTPWLRMLLLLAFLATPVIARAAAPPAAPAAPPAGQKKAYSLRARPTVGQRIAYEQSI